MVTAAAELAISQPAVSRAIADMERGRAPLTTLTIHLCCRLTASGRFVTLLPASILRFGSYDEHIEGACGRNTQPATRPVAVVTLKNRTLNPVAELFIECVRSVAKQSFCNAH